MIFVFREWHEFFMQKQINPWNVERFSLGGAAPRPVREGSAAGSRAGE
jgi:hypothetical protein